MIWKPSKNGKGGVCVPRPECKKFCMDWESLDKLNCDCVTMTEEKDCDDDEKGSVWNAEKKMCVERIRCPIDDNM